MEQKILSSIKLSSKNRELRLVFEKRPRNLMRYSKYMKYTAIKWNSTKLTTRSLLWLPEVFSSRSTWGKKRYQPYANMSLAKGQRHAWAKRLDKNWELRMKSLWHPEYKEPYSISHQFGSTGMVSPVCISSMSLEQPFMAATGLHWAFGS